MTDRTEQVPVSGAVDVLRRGARATPVLREGLGITVGLAVLGALGRVVVPVLTPPVVDRALTRAAVDIFLAVQLSLLAGVLIVATALIVRLTRVRLARASE